LTESNLSLPSSKKIKAWDDKYVPNFTYTQADKIFRDNLNNDYEMEWPR